MAYKWGFSPITTEPSTGIPSSKYGWVTVTVFRIWIPQSQSCCFKNRLKVGKFWIRNHLLLIQVFCWRKNNNNTYSRCFNSWPLYFPYSLGWSLIPPFTQKGHNKITTGWRREFFFAWLLTLEIEMRSFTKTSTTSCLCVTRWFSRFFGGEIPRPIKRVVWCKPWWKACEFMAGQPTPP